MLSRLKTLAEQGDTIVEVMMVLAVLGLAISISYATANRSLLDARQAQENTQATEFAQTQVENLSIVAYNSISGQPAAANAFLQAGRFCINSPLSATPIETTLSNCDFGSTSYKIRTVIYNCKLYGGIPNPCAGYAGPNSDTFVVQASWPDVFGDGTDTVTLLYRDHPQN